MATKKSNNNKQPNILVIWGDDIGISNLSCYTHGLMGYQTPNIDRIAREGMVNHAGVVYEQDLGPSTDAVARAMTRFNPDASWRKASPP